MSVYAVDSRRSSEIETERNGRDRFPSLHLNTDSFVRIGWNDPMPPEETHKLTFYERFRVWLSQIPRKVWFILIAVIIAGFSILVVALILIFALPHKDTTPDVYNNVSPSTHSPPPPTVPSPKPIPYPLGYIPGTLERFYPCGDIDTIVADTRGYVFRNRLLAYSPNSTYVVVNETTGIPLPWLSEPEGCDGCRLLSVSDDCLMDSSCTTKDVVLCCQHCGGEKQVCLVGETSFQFSGESINFPMSSDGEQLMITNFFEVDNRTTAFQVDRVNETGFVHSGPVLAYSIPAGVPKGAIVIDPNYGSKPDLVVWMVGNGTFVYEFEGNMTSVVLDMNGTVLEMQTTVAEDGNHALVALLQSSQFQVIRINLRNRCASFLVRPQVFLFSGQLRGSFWGGKSFFLWFFDQRSLAGVSIVNYSFVWPNDDPCPYSA